MALSPRDRRALIILGVIAAAVLGFFFLTRGGAPPPPEEAALPSPPPPPGVAPSPSPEPRPPRFTFFSGRDPFLPLVVEAVPGAGEAPAGDGAAAPEEPTGEPVAEPPPGAEQQAPEAGATVGGRSVTLIDIIQQDGGQVAQVEVDGQPYVVAEGEQFADNFSLESIQGGCASFLFGDEAFTLCEGGERK
jgi:hypothetical protein